MDAYEPPVIVEKADESVSPNKFTQNPMFKPKVEGGDMIQDESSKVDDVPDVIRETLMSELDTDEIIDDNLVVTSPDLIKADITTISRTPVEFTTSICFVIIFVNVVAIDVIGLRITAGEAVNKFDNVAVDVMKKELQQMIDKKVWRPVIVSDRTTEELRSIIPSSIFLKKRLSRTVIYARSTLLVLI
jgi:hypothetical protein